MNILLRESVRGFELCYPYLVEEVSSYTLDRLGYLIVKMINGRTLIYDDSTQSYQDLSNIDPRKYFGERLRDRMYGRAMSQKELAERSGLSEQTISNYINGRKKPSFETVSLLADILNCSTDDFRYIEPKE